MLPFLREEKVGLREQLVFSGNRLEIFLPAYFLDESEKIATVVGRKIETLGLFWFRVDEKSMYEMQVPIKLEFEFSERYKKSFKLSPEIPEFDYEVFVLRNGDAFVYDTNHKQSVDDMNWFMSKLIEGAKLPPTVSYDEVFQLFTRALQITKIDAGLGVPSLILEFLASELLRNRRNMSEPFRMVYDGKKNSPYDYRMVRITKLPEQNSTFTSLMGEDIKQQLVSSVLRTREGKKDRITPIEKVIKY